jgi:hypothetical protein
MSAAASFHLFDPQKGVRFVKGSEELSSDVQPEQPPELNGDEIRTFYEELVNQPSTSAIVQHGESLIPSVYTMSYSFQAINKSSVLQWCKRPSKYQLVQ